VLEHLGRFCKAEIVLEPQDATGRIDPMKVMHYQGQRSVYCHIKRMLEQPKQEQETEFAENG